MLEVTYIDFLIFFTLEKNEGYLTSTP